MTGPPGATWAGRRTSPLRAELVNSRRRLTDDEHKAALLARDERNALIVAEVAKGKSLRAAAKVVGVPEATARRAVSGVSATAPTDAVAPRSSPTPTIPAKLEGRDGKLRPSSKPSPEALEARAERVEEARCGLEVTRRGKRLRLACTKTSFSAHSLQSKVLRNYPFLRVYQRTNYAIFRCMVCKVLQNPLPIIRSMVDTRGLVMLLTIFDISLVLLKDRPQTLTLKFLSRQIAKRWRFFSSAFVVLAAAIPVVFASIGYHLWTGLSPR